MSTMRDLILEAYRESGVVGNGMSMTSEQLSDGVKTLNTILDGVFSTNLSTATVDQDITFTGQTSYTIGLAPVLQSDPTPDIEVGSLPQKIDNVFVMEAGQLVPIPELTPDEYFSRDNNLGTIYPTGWYLQRTNPLYTLYFAEGSPSGTGKLLYRIAMVDVTANTRYSGFPKQLRPYLVYELASRIAQQNTFDGTQLKMAANQHWNQYISSCYQGQGYNADRSAPGFSGSGKYNIYRGD